jgi:predicted house-cleaning noncanonical NTP pyrophosphatase (MazG superfamily)
MTFEQLVDFIEHKMSMSHIYQPLLIRSLVDAGGIATLRQLAQAFLAQDESQLRYYEQRIKEMPAKVLARHGVVEREGGTVDLTVKNLTFEQRVRIRALCDERLGAYLAKRGLGVWDYRLLADPVPDNLRYQVLAESGGRCALCGATKHERPLDVDHIVPLSRGGASARDNLQVLCSKCNRSKGNKDTRDFRGEMPPVKLVRDRVPELMAASGRIAETRKLADPEFRLMLKRKLVEEADELAAAPSREDLVAEAADVLEVLYAILQTEGIGPDEVEQVRLRRLQEKGGFRQRVLLTGIQTRGEAEPR